MHGSTSISKKFALAQNEGVLKDAHPEQKSPVTFKSWKDFASKCSEQCPQLRKMWQDPDWSAFKLRSKAYLQDHVKAIPESPLFELVWFDMIKGEHADLLHISKSKKSFLQKALAKYGKDVPQMFVVTLIIPGSPLVACVQYFALKNEAPNSRINREVEGLWKRFFNGDDKFRRERLKLVPSILEGPWIVKKGVGNKPVILSRALECHYFRGDNYLEVAIDVGSDRVANYVTGLARTYSTCAVADLGFVIEGRDESELPEAMLGCVQYNHIDLTYAQSFDD